ncbi:extracellular solute-binding protein [Natronolimnobius sp. AArcel1]|uniref:extracellular solute-binding protein n=1 Tax=Natronolimnobius sp. AArcel1 TaxID=1679093 RepID=UPI0013EA4E08|nr:extracellular solute-binding protein [Natronolimnobius sp. AArcel1]NGM71126.1 extracellular solute-binding protein [Natronolimnobius sp. AArcel1]
MTLNRRTVLKSTTGVAVGAALAGCLGGGGDGGSSGDAEIYHERTGSERDVIEGFIDQFNEENDDEFEITAEQVSELGDQIDTAVPAGDGPELYDWAHDWLGEHVERELVYDVSDDLEIDIEEEFVDTGVDAISHNGGVYALPTGGEVPTLMYDQNKVDEAPETLEEMVEIMEEHHDPSAGEYGFTMEFNEYMCTWVTHAFGGYYYSDEEEETGLDQPEVWEGMEVVRDSLWEYAPNDREYDPQFSTFQNGNAPFSVNGPWGVGDLEDSEVDLGIAPLPTIEGNEPRPYTGVDMYYFSIENEDEERREAAIAFAEWVSTNQDNLLELVDEHGYIPVHQELSGSDELPETIEPFSETFEMGIPMPSDIAMDYVWDPTDEAVAQVLTQDADIEEAFTAAAEEIRETWDDEDIF